MWKLQHCNVKPSGSISIDYMDTESCRVRHTPTNCLCAPTPTTRTNAKLHFFFFLTIVSPAASLAACCAFLIFTL